MLRFSYRRCFTVFTDNLYVQRRETTTRQTVQTKFALLDCNRTAYVGRRQRPSYINLPVKTDAERDNGANLLNEP